MQFPSCEGKMCIYIYVVPTALGKVERQSDHWCLRATLSSQGAYILWLQNDKKNLKLQHAYKNRGDISNHLTNIKEASNCSCEMVKYKQIKMTEEKNKKVKRCISSFVANQRQTWKKYRETDCPSALTTRYSSIQEWEKTKNIKSSEEYLKN